MTTHTGTTNASDGTSIFHYTARNSPHPAHPSLIFLHYYGGSPSTWAPLLAQPAFASFHTVCYHARGWAPSTGPSTDDAYDIAAMSSDLSAILSATGCLRNDARFVLVGHSMGGKVAQHYAATTGAALPQLQGLILVAPAPLRGLELPAEAKRQQLAAYQSPESAEFVLNNVLTAGPGTLGEEVMAACVRDSLRGNEWATRAWPEYALGEDFGELLGGIQVPVVVLRGDGDFEREIVGELGVEAGWVNRVVEGCGHLVPLERPVQLGEMLLEFVGQIS